MAQIGSYVPAESMKLGMLDGILIRMGGQYLIINEIVTKLNVVSSLGRAGTGQINFYG